MLWLTRWNYFDRGSEGDRYVRGRTWTNLALILAAITFVKSVERFAGAAAGKLAIAAAALFFAVWIATGFIRYMRRLDEMQRQVHYESVAIAYALIMAAAVALGLLHEAFHWTFNPLYLIGFEVVRGLALNWLTWKRA